jgi:mono/diheme cytochrome c family protein
MKFKPALPLIVGVLATAVPAHAASKVTYYEDVAPIMRANCQGCHQPTGKNIGSLVAPMSLMTYEETRPWARAIAKKV